jgi:deaminated glutathione amidase
MPCLPRRARPARCWRRCPSIFRSWGARIPTRCRCANSLVTGRSRNGLWIVAGTLPLACADPGRVRNSCLVFDPAGRQLARYDKIHLFGFHRGQDQYEEARTIEPGDRTVHLDTPYGRWGLSVCYDLRFPELYRALGAPDLIFAPAAFTETTGRAHWELLIRTRAVENLAYVIAPGPLGRRPSTSPQGSTIMVEP